MANGHEILSSGNTSENLADSLINFMNDSVISFPNDEAINNISNFKTNLSFDDSGYLWKGDLSQLKCFVKNDLNLEGKWTSPGGERKLFSDSTTGIMFRWSGPTRGKLTIVKDTKQDLLVNTLNRFYRKYTVEPNLTTTSKGLAPKEGDNISTIPQVANYWSRPSVTQNTNVNVKDRNATASSDAVHEGCVRFSNSINRVLQRDLDILKLDVSILEARLPSAISENESNIDSIRIKQKNTELVIGQQQQTIRKLHEENQLFKFKLNLIEKQLLELTKNKQENNVNNRKLPVGAFNTSSVTLPSESNQFVNLNTSESTINLMPTDKTPSLNDIVPSVDDLSEPPNQYNTTGIPTQASLNNDSNVTSETVLHSSTAPRTVQVQLKEYPLKHQPVHTANQSVNSKQLSRMQTKQSNFDEQIKEYKQKHRRLLLDQRKKKFFKERISHPMSRRRENKRQRNSYNKKNAVNQCVRPDNCPQKRRNFHITTSNKRPPDWSHYLKLVSQVTTS